MKKIHWCYAKAVYKVVSYEAQHPFKKALINLDPLVVSGGICFFFQNKKIAWAGKICRT